MYEILLDLHNILRWVILIALLYVLVKSWSAMNAKRAFTNGERKGALILLIARAAWFQTRVLHDEERLQKIFGAEYTDYCRKVRRWIPGLV